jgi:biotin carboxyl carrier protein
LSSGTSISINGEQVEPRDADIVETEPNVYSILVDGAVYEARVSGSEISIGGVRFRFEVEDPRQWKRSTRGGGSQGRASIIAAMPGKIVRVLVSAGDEVTTGQGVLVIEAMKMQNELKAPRSGRVTAIEVKPNDSVNAGALLATIEPAVEAES